MSSKKSAKICPSSKQDETPEPKTLSSFWWKLSVNERNKHFHTIKVFILAPMLFAPECQNELLFRMALQAGILMHGSNGELSDEELSNVESLESAVYIIQENLSKFDECGWLLENMIKSIQEMERDYEKQKPDSTYKYPRYDQWLKHLRRKMTDLGNREKMNERDAVIVYAAKHVCRYVQELHSGVNHFEMYRDLSQLMEQEIIEEKIRGNMFFKEELYEQAILVYTNILRCKLALADSKRTVVLEPSYDKGHYRYAESLENLNRIDDAIIALRTGVTLCKPKDSLEKYLSKLIHHAGKKKQEIRLKKVLPTYPPDLTWPSSGDDSSVDYDEGAVLNLCGCMNCSALQNMYETPCHSHGVHCNECYPLHDDRTDTDESNTDSDVGTCSSSASKSSKGSSTNQQIKKSANKNKPVKSPLLRLYAEMREGTEFLLARKFLPAKSSYSQVLGLISSKKDLSLPKNDEVVLIYAHGIACFEIGKPKDLKLARSQFNRIIQNFKDIYFPLAYYGYGKVLHKQAKFFEMRLMLMNTIESLDKKDMVTLKWPGSDVIIDETRPGKLKETIVALLDSLSSQSIPDAICKYKKCNLKDRYISFNDHDFKGFVRLICSESCRIEYHTHCWKRQKSDYQDKITEKEMLNRSCVTPDCSGVLFHIIMYAKPNGMVEREFKADIVKKPENENHRIDKSKRMKSCSYKKQQKRLRRLREKERWSEERIKKTNDDIENILKELDAEDEQFRIKEKPPNPFINKDKLPLFLTGNQIPPVPPEPDPPSDFDFYILNNGENSEEGSKTAKEKRKDKKKKKKLKNTHSLEDFLGPESVPKNHENTAAREFERSDSLSSSVTSNDIPLITPDPPLTSSSNKQSEDGTLESNVKEHLFTMFEDLLISKGSMDVENDECVQDLFKLLDVFSTELIIKSGGLRNFLSLSPKFVFDPDNRNVVYPEDEAEIFLLSRKEAAVLNQINRSVDLPRMQEKHAGSDLAEGANVWPSVSENEIKNVSKSEDSSKLSSGKRSIDKPSNDDKKELQEEIEEKPMNDPKIPSKNNFTCTATNTKNNFNFTPPDFSNFKLPSAHFTNPTQPFITRPLFNPYLKFGGTYRQDTVMRGFLPNLKTSQRSNTHEGDENITEQINEPPFIKDTLQKEFATTEGRFHFIDNSIVKETIDVAVMTDANEAMFEEMYEKEVLEKSQLTEKYDDLLDSFEQYKKRVRLEKDKLQRTEEDRKSRIEALEQSLAKERQAREKELKKWNNEKETFKERICHLDRKMSRSEETQYKEKLAEKENELKKSFEKIGELKLQMGRERCDNEDIISKLETCVNEQSKRAQTAEVLYLDLKKIEVCHGFKNILSDADKIIFTIDHSPYQDPSVNKKEMRKAWMNYARIVSENLGKCRADLEERLRKVKSGIPLEEIPAFTVPQNPVPPPQPKIFPLPSNGQNQPPPPTTSAPQNGIPIYIPRIPTSDPRQMEHPDLRWGNMNGGSHSSMNSFSNANMTSGASAYNPTGNGIKEMPDAKTSSTASVKNGLKQLPSGPESHATKNGQMSSVGYQSQISSAGYQGSIDVNKKYPDLHDSTSNANNLKASNFDRILVRLGAKFPSYERNDLIKLLKEFREKRNNTLSGLTAEDIIDSISKIIIQKENLKQSRKPRKPTRSKPKWGTVATNNDSSFGFEEPCIICHEDMLHVTRTTKLQCGHVFHTECIRRWLNEQRTCPTCRDHALLQEDFPSLH